MSNDKPRGDGSELAQLNVYQKMAFAQNKFRYVQKDRPKGLQYAVVLHDAVTAKARAALLEARIYALPTVEEHGQETNRTWARVRMEYINIDDPKDRFSVTMFGYGNDSQDKGPGKAISYATKYCHLKAFGVETGEDADMHNVETDIPVTQAWLLKKLGEHVKTNDLDREYVSERIGKIYGDVTQISLDALEGVVASIGDEPNSWRKETAGV